MKTRSIIALLLALLLGASALVFGICSAASGQKAVISYDQALIYDEFADDKIAERVFDSVDDWDALSSQSSWKTWDAPTEFRLNCNLTTYYRTTDLAPTGAIIYAVGLNIQRLGTESDVDIIDDFLEDGYIVVVADFLDSELAVSPALDAAASILSYELSVKKQFVGSYYTSDLAYDTFVLPAGYRLERNIEFFDVLDSGASGTIEAILTSWNKSTTKTVVESKGIEWKNATSLDDMIMPNGKPITDIESGNREKFFTYHLDISYPSQPDENLKAPVFAVSSGSTVRVQSGSSGHPERTHAIGALFRGYVSVAYDHEYMPYMHTRDSYGHIDGSGFSIQSYTGVKMHTAAVRCIKKYAEQFGYSNEQIGVMGHSKSSMVVLLSAPNPEKLSEIIVSNGYKQGQTYGAQPYLTYSDGTPISSDVTCVYHSMGYGSIHHEKYLTPSTKPTYIACGVLDNANPAPRDYWEEEFENYSESKIPFAAAFMPEIGHTIPPMNTDPIYGYNYYESICDFFDYYLLGANPEIMYTGIEASGRLDANDKGLFIYFSGPITEWSLLEGVSVTDSDKNEVEGKWVADCGSTRWVFVTDSFKPGETYTLKVDGTVADINNRSIGSGIEKNFTVK